MAPTWMVIAKTVAAWWSKLSSDEARIKWPVEEIGRNSVMPSMMPSRMTLIRSGTRVSATIGAQG
jgi:hypothetical protein